MATKQYPYTTPANYTYDTDKVEVSGGVASLKEDLTNVYARWHLNESSGTNVPDSSGNGRDGTCVNMEDGDWVAGKLNNCLQFDGVNEYVSFGDIANFERTDAFSVECWFKTTTDNVLIGRMVSGSSYTGWLVRITLGKLGLYLVHDVSDNYLHVKSTAIVDTGIWVHAIVTYDGSSDASGAKIYINGVEGTDIVIDTLTDSIQNPSNCCLASYNGASGFFVGSLDEAVIHNKELNLTEVSYKYNSGSGRENEKSSSDKPTIEPTDLFDPVAVNSWDSFLETLGGGNEGSIGYNLYKVDKANKYYWNGSAWITGGDSDHYNSQAIINTNIGSFDASPDKIGFIAYLISDGEQVIELDENQITYTAVIPPLVNAGSNKSCKDNDTIASFSDCSFSDPDGTVDHAYYKVDGEVDTWTEIFQGGYGTLLEAVQAFNYQFNNSGTKTCRLQAEDNVGAKSEDSLEVDVQKFQVTFNIKDSQGNHIANIYFKPGDGSGYVEKHSPFTYGYDYNASGYDIVVDKGGYGIQTQNIPSTDHAENFTLIALIDTSEFANDMKRMLGLTHENMRITNPIYDALGNLTNCKIKIYANATDCENDTNPIAQYDATATYDGNVRLSYKSKRI